MIDGVIITPLKVVEAHTGQVMHMLRSDSPVFAGFGEVYFSTIHPGSVKAWRRHNKMVANLAVPVGRVRIILFDQTANEAQEVILGKENYALLTVPPRIWSGFQGLGGDTSVIANCASIPHDPEEIERRSPDDPAIPYQWLELAI